MKLFNKFISFMSAAIMVTSAVSFAFANAATDFTEPSPYKCIYYVDRLG